MLSQQLSKNMHLQIDSITRFTRWLFSCFCIMGIITLFTIFSNIKCGYERGNKLVKILALNLNPFLGRLRDNYYLQFAILEATLENITDVKNLPILLSMGTHSRRPNLEGFWIKDKIDRLAHDIIKPGKLESLYDTNKNYEVTVNGIAFNIKATSRSKAKYKTWKKHQHYNKSITSMKNVKIKKLREQSNSIATNDGGQ